jgi:Tol biopolymer transport system component
MNARLVQAGILAITVVGACDTTAPDEDVDDHPTYGTAAAPLEALEAVSFDALGGTGRLVFARMSAGAKPSGIYVIDAAARSSWGFSGEVYESPAVSPDGQSIAFATLARYSSATPNNFYDLFVVDARGANLRRLSSNEGQDRSPSWTPDGSEVIYYVSRAIGVEVYRRPREGAAAIKHSVFSVSFCVSLDGPVSFSPQGDFAFAAVACTNSTSAVSGYGIFVSRADAPGIVRVAGSDFAQSAPGVQYHAPAWSPDGNRLAFMEISFSTALAPTATRVRVMNADGTNLRTIVDVPVNITAPFGNFSGGNVYSLAWSPDGTRIAFNHHLEPLVASIYVARTDGTGLTRITNAAATDRSLSWSR